MPEFSDLPVVHLNAVQQRRKKKRCVVAAGILWKQTAQGGFDHPVFE